MWFWIFNIWIFLLVCVHAKYTKKRVVKTLAQSQHQRLFKILSNHEFEVNHTTLLYFYMVSSEQYCADSYMLDSGDPLIMWPRPWDAIFNSTSSHIVSSSRSWDELGIVSTARCYWRDLPLYMRGRINVECCKYCACINCPGIM